MKPAPRHLSAAARAWFVELQREYGIDDAGGRATLVAAAEAFDRLRGARELLAKQGLVVRDRFGKPVAHPAVRIETSARAQLLAALKQLHLDVEPLKPIGRPPRPVGVTEV